MTTLIISNEEIKDILTIFKFLEESGLLTKDVRETFENEVKGITYKFIWKTVSRQTLNTWPRSNKRR